DHRERAFQSDVSLGRRAAHRQSPRPRKVRNGVTLTFIRGRSRSHMVKRRQTSNRRRQQSIMAFEMVRLDRKAAEPLHHQLYRQIRDELRSGNFSRSSSRLPSSRALAAELGVSRLTVNDAFAQLHAEGFL